MTDGQTADLLARARAGDADAIEELLLRHDPAVRASIDINPKWRSVLEPDDVLQVTYLEAVLDLPSFDGDDEGLASWLRAIARNNLRDAIRALERDKRPHPDRRVTPAAGQDSVLWLWNELTGGGASPSRGARNGEIRELLEERVAQLPNDYAETIRLVHFQGRSLTDAANVLGRTYGAVHLLHQRALSRLRRSLGSETRYLTD